MEASPTTPSKRKWQIWFNSRGVCFGDRATHTDHTEIGYIFFVLGGWAVYYYLVRPFYGH